MIEGVKKIIKMKMMFLYFRESGKTEKEKEWKESEKMGKMRKNKIKKRWIKGEGVVYV
jgi:hypothetical protein